MGFEIMALDSELLPNNAYPIRISTTRPRLEPIPFEPRDPPILYDLWANFEQEVIEVIDFSLQKIPNTYAVDFLSVIGADNSLMNNVNDWFTQWYGQGFFAATYNDGMVTPLGPVGVLTGITLNTNTVLDTIYNTFDYHLELNLVTPPTMPDQQTAALEDREDGRSSYSVYWFSNPGFLGQPDTPTSFLIPAAEGSVITEDQLGSLYVTDVQYSGSGGVQSGFFDVSEERTLTVSGLLTGLFHPIGVLVEPVRWRGYRWDLNTIEYIDRDRARVNLTRQTASNRPLEGSG